MSGENVFQEEKAIKFNDKTHQEQVQITFLSALVWHVRVVQHFLDTQMSQTFSERQHSSLSKNKLRLVFYYPLSESGLESKITPLIGNFKVCLAGWVCLTTIPETMYF